VIIRGVDPFSDQGEMINGRAFDPGSTHTVALSRSSR
jgi:hypothetical protein